NLKDIAHVVSELSALDEDINSPLALFKRYFNDGQVIGIDSEVMDVLEYAVWFLGQQPETKIKAARSVKLDRVINQVLGECLGGVQEDSKKSAIRAKDSLRHYKGILSNCASCCVKGPRGNKGKRGKRGATGATGVTGATGIGVTGATGAT